MKTFLILGCIMFGIVLVGAAFWYFVYTVNKNYEESLRIDGHNRKVKYRQDLMQGKST